MDKGRVTGRHVTRREPTKEAKVFASVIMWFFLALFLGTILGGWIKFYWIGWVFAK